MKKQLVASLAAAMVLGVAGTSFAASNPFTDVPANSWAYASVQKLVQAGIIDGEGNGKFDGSRVITRYEMATMVAKAMSKEDKANAMQKAELNKLEVEFADELQKIGVRVDALEKNQANLKFAGNLTLRDTDKDFVNSGNNTGNGDVNRYRLRLDATATVDENTTAGFRIVTVDPLQNPLGTNGLPTNTTWHNFGATTSTSMTATTNPNAAATGADMLSIDRAWVSTNIAGIKTTVGNQALVIGVTNGIVDSGAISFTGAKFSKQFGSVQAVANYGRLVSKIDVSSLELSSTRGKMNYGVGYFDIQNDAAGLQDSYLTGSSTFGSTVHWGKDILKLAYGDATYIFNPKLSMTVEGGENRAAYASDYNKYYNIFAKVGDQILDAKGKQNFVAEYYSVGANSLALDNANSGFTSTTANNGASNGLTTLDTVATATKFTGLDLSYNRAFSKNLSTEFHYVRIDNPDATINNYNYYRVNVIAKF